MRESRSVPSAPQHDNASAIESYDPTGIAAAIADDAGVAVIILDSAITIRHANASAADLLAREDELSHRPLTDLCPSRLASEMADVANEACSTSAPVDLVGMIAGSWRRISFRPVRFEDKRCVMMACPVDAPPLDAPRDHRPIRRAAHDDLGALADLTARELEVIRLIALGLTTTQIAQTLSRSIKTIDGHLLSIRAKLGPLTRTELARLAIDAGLTRIDADEVRRVARQARSARREATATN
ncbi:MAG: helix-turn-helix transcriptional regulator [Phycisphaerales bacterium]